MGTFETIKSMTTTGGLKGLSRKWVLMAETRVKPDDGDEFAWPEFESYANGVGIGMHRDDWIIDWETWCTAFKCGYNYARKEVMADVKVDRESNI